MLVAGGLDVPPFLGQRGHLHLGPVRRSRRPAAAHGRRPDGPARPRTGATRPRDGPPALHLRLADRRRSKARTRHRSSSPRRTSTSSTPPTGRSTSTRPAPASDWSAPSPAGRAPTAARRACTRPTSTTRRTRSAPSTTPATCRSCSAPTAPPSAGSSCPATVALGRALEARPAAPGRHGAVRPGRRAEADACAPPRRPWRPPAHVDGGVLARGRRHDVTYRRSGDDNLLVEFGADAARPGARGCASTR